MATTLLGVFTDRAEADHAIRDLVDSGVPKGRLHLERIDGDSADRLDVTPDQRRRLRELVGVGATLVRAIVPDDQVPTIRTTMMRRGGTVFAHVTVDGNTIVDDADISVLQPGSFAYWEFEDHYLREYATSGMTLEEMMPAYEFGYHFGTEQGYENMWKDWNQVNQEARRRWEAQHSGTWDLYELAIQEGWAAAPARLTGASLM